MKLLVELLNNLRELKEREVTLKSWLADKEVVEYSKWKEDNPKDRTAREKVLDVLKMEDPEWLNKIDEYQRVKLDYDNVKYIYNIIEGMIKNPNYTKADVEYFIELLEKGE